MTLACFSTPGLRAFVLDGGWKRVFQVKADVSLRLRFTCLKFWIIICLQISHCLNILLGPARRVPRPACAATGGTLFLCSTGDARHTNLAAASTAVGRHLESEVALSFTQCLPSSVTPSRASAGGCYWAFTFWNSHSGAHDSQRRRTATMALPFVPVSGTPPRVRH